MSKTIILAEKPSQALAYSRAFHSTKQDGYYEVFPDSVFPNGAKITWGIGHLVELYEPSEYDVRYKKWELSSLPIIPNDNEYKYKVKADVKKQYEIVKILLSQASEIIISCDPDREGEAIARQIVNHTGNSHKPTKRLWINSQEKEEVIRGFKHLEDGDKFIPLYHEAQARQIGDWLVGMNSSRLYTLMLQNKGIRESFSVGRVQTPTLSLIYQRQKEIADFKPEPFFEMKATFKSPKGAYEGKMKERFKSKEELDDFLNKANIQMKDESAIITELLKTIKKKSPPKLHSLSTLQTIANSKYKYSPSKVLKIVQSLYDSPLTLVSYPRTDTQYITTNEFDYLRDNFEGYKKLVNADFEPESLEPKSRYVNNSKVQEHYAIIPTKKIPTASTFNNLTPEQKNIYLEIVYSVLGMFHHDYVYEETEIHTEVKEQLFFTKGTVNKSLGWKELIKTESKENESILPDVDKGMNCKADLNIHEGKTNAPKPFTEGQLINLMKYCGKYIGESDESVLETLKEVEGLGTEATRSNIIEALKNQKYIEVKKNIVHVTKKGEILCESVKGTLLSKPEMTAKWETYLKKIGKQEGNQQTFIKNVTSFVQKLVNETTPESLNVDTTIKEIEDQKNICKCPTCKTGFIVDKGKFYGCSDYKDGCKQTFAKKILKKSITKKNIIDLCTKKKTSKIKGFEGKKPFEAHLVLDSNGKIEFAFK